MSVTRIYFTADDRPFIGHLCQYGNLHFDLYDERLAGELPPAAHEAGLHLVEGVCRERFPSGGVAGRMLNTEDPQGG